MPNIKNIEGQKFGTLLVLRRWGRDKNGKVKWLCHCDCSNDVIKLGNSLLRGSVKSCGHSHRGRGPGVTTWCGFGEIPGKYFSQIKSNARKGGRHFNLEIEDLWNLYLFQDRKCALSGVSIDFRSKSASLDRVD